ncbi:unnamed protein product, partial [Brassica napus]
KKTERRFWRRSRRTNFPTDVEGDRRRGRCREASMKGEIQRFAICVVAGLLKTVAENKDLKKRKMTEIVTDSYVWGASSHSV